MRILITGVTGQVGSALLTRLSALHDVIAADRKVIDLTQPHNITTVLDRLQPDVIINPGAYTAVDRAEDERNLAFAVNARAPAALAAWSAQNGRPFIHFSTDYVFDGSGIAPWREDDTTAPLNVYGESKLAGERAVRESCAPHLIVRTSWVYDSHGNNFLRAIARLAGERETLRIVNDQIGAPTSAALIADAIKTLVAGGALATRFSEARGVVHLAARGETSWHGFATAIVTGLKRRGISLAAKTIEAIPAASYPTRAARPLNSRLDMTRLRSVFDIETPPWPTALERELDVIASAARPSGLGK